MSPCGHQQKKDLLQRDAVRSALNAHTGPAASRRIAETAHPSTKAGKSRDLLPLQEPCWLSAELGKLGTLGSASCTKLQMHVSWHARLGQEREPRLRLFPARGEKIG